MKKMNLGILFDLEGTLVESGYQKYPKILEKLHLDTKKMLLDIGIPKYVINKYNKSVYLRNVADYWAEKNLKYTELIAFRMYVENFMIEYDMFSAKYSSKYPETEDILKYLKKKNYEIGLVTNTSKKATNFILNKLNLNSFFDTIITRQDVKKLKPNPEMLIIASKKMKSNVKWIVGDSFVDVEAARKAKIKSILIKRDGSKPKYKVNYLVYNLKELKNIF